MRKSAIGLGLLAALIGAVAFAQQPVTVFPTPLTTTRGSAIIASTNTFQSVFAAATPRAGSRGRSACQVVNNSSTTLWVFVGPIASATTPTALSLAQHGQWNCELAAGTIVQDQISVTGTSGASFFAVAQ